jgi:hypothetical protein
MRSLADLNIEKSYMVESHWKQESKQFLYSFWLPQVVPLKYVGALSSQVPFNFHKVAIYRGLDSVYFMKKVFIPIESS